MQNRKFSLVLFLLLGLGTFATAQLFDFLNPPACQPLFTETEFTSIMHNNGELRGDDGGPLYILPDSRGTLNVTTVQVTEHGNQPVEKVAFFVGIKGFRTNTIWLYNQTPSTELDVPSLLAQCGQGDRLVFMVADRKYRLPRFEVMVGDGGC